MIERYKPRERNLSSSVVMENSIGRDQAAVVLPLAMIDVVSNIREKPEGVEELAVSIRQHGLLQPLLVRKNGAKFELVAGHRRLLALKALGATEAPCRIANATENEIQVLQLVENLCREDLSGWETCSAIYALLPLFGDNQTKLAEVLGKDRTYVSHAVAVIRADLKSEYIHTLSLFELFKLAGKKSLGGHSDTEPRSLGSKPEASVLLFRESKNQGWNLRVKFDPSKITEKNRQAIIEKLEELLVKLKE